MCVAVYQTYSQARDEFLFRMRVNEVNITPLSKCISLSLFVSLFGLCYNFCVTVKEMSVQNRVWHHCIHHSFPVSPPSLSPIWLFPTPLSLSLSRYLTLTLIILSTLHPLSFKPPCPPPAYFSVDGDLSRPWLTLAQPPPPLCSLWWWGSLSCDTDAESAGWASDWKRDSPELQTLGKDRGKTDCVSKALHKDSVCSAFVLLWRIQTYFVSEGDSIISLLRRGLPCNKEGRTDEEEIHGHPGWEGLAHCASDFLSWQNQ